MKRPVAGHSRAQRLGTRPRKPDSYTTNFAPKGSSRYAAEVVQNTQTPGARTRSGSATTSKEQFVDDSRAGVPGHGVYAGVACIANSSCLELVKRDRAHVGAPGSKSAVSTVAVTSTAKIITYCFVLGDDIHWDWRTASGSGELMSSSPQTSVQMENVESEQAVVARACNPPTILWRCDWTKRSCHEIKTTPRPRPATFRDARAQ